MGGNLKLLLSFVDGGQVSKLSRKVLTLPKQVNKKLHNTLAFIQEQAYNLELTCFQIIQVNPCRAFHQILVSFRYHYSVESPARIARFSWGAFKAKILAQQSLSLS